jgi:hypothetical protein
MTASIAAVGIGEGAILVYSATFWTLGAAAAVGAWVAVTAIRRHLPGDAYDSGYFAGYDAGYEDALKADAVAAPYPVEDGPDLDLDTIDPDADTYGEHAADPEVVEVTGLLPVVGDDLLVQTGGEPS